MLDSKAVNFYQKQGYWLHKKPLFSVEKFNRLRQVFEHILAQKEASLRADQLDVPHFEYPELFEFLLADEVLDIIEPILGPNIGLWSSHFICKEPEVGRATPWHEDSAYWNGRMDRMDQILTVWLAIDRSDRENGCMRVIPGSHFNGFSEYENIDTEKNTFSRQVIPDAIDESKAVYFGLEPNESSLHDARLIHGATANTSALRRCGYTMRYFSLESHVFEKRNINHPVWLCRGKNLGGSILARLPKEVGNLKGHETMQNKNNISSDGSAKFNHKWGYSDTKFEFVGDTVLRVTGDRYPICGYDMPYFIPFAEEAIGVSFRPKDIVQEKSYGPLPSARTNQDFETKVSAKLRKDQIRLDDEERLRHSHGQLSVNEVYRVLYGESLDRLVDLVLYPENEEQVRLIITLAIEYNVCLIPYGGGTNVSGALSLHAEEARTIVSVDMCRMNKILSIDKENLLAEVQAGICGGDLEQELRANGFTSGHDPDSLEFSTLGGWISTNASGMKKNRYGNIEDIVLDATLITPTGTIETSYFTPRNSIGVQPRGLLFGSEGNFGVITKAMLKIHRLPEMKKFGSLVFPSFENGVKFLKKLRQEVGVLPASIRLVNNNEFRFGQALSPQSKGWKKIEKKLQDFFLYKVKGFDPKKCVACTIAMEGTKSEVDYQRKVIFTTAKQFGAISGGAKKGERGYMLTFGIAYIRDFFNQFQILGETMETSAPWDCILDVTSAVSSRLLKECSERKILGRPYLAFRVTQTYQTGVCIYFTMAFSGAGQERPSEVYHEIENALRQEILDNGGSLSHHHGIGKVRKVFLPQIQSENSIEIIRKTKNSLDPKNTFATGNGVFGDSK
ncbi:MAG: FAD-binding protein [Candidatus Latescibacterota bacterium]|nr:FAD-binding protein [Candidatus Latescibacterota bacterium]